MTEEELTGSSYLIVDDDDFSRELLVSVLSHLGCNTVYCAPDSETAIGLARQYKPDFVLLDIYMPEVDGWTFLSQLRKTMPSAVVIMITGSGKTADFRKSMTEAVDGFCIKPVSPSVLHRALIGTRLHQQSQTA